MITEAIRSYAEDKTSKLPRFYDDIRQVEVTVDKGETGTAVNVEVIARGEHGNVFVAVGTGDDAHQGIDAAVHKLEGQLRKKKTRERDNKHVGGHEPE